AAAQNALNGAQADENTKKTASDAADAQRATGYVGFLNDRGLGSMTGQFTSGWYAQYVKLGKDGDATVLSNVRKALEYVNHVNDIRRGLGLGELAVTDSMMTNAILHADASAHTQGHTGGMGGGQNLVIGDCLGENISDAYYDPNGSWYTSEMDFYNRLVDENKVPGLTKFEPGHITQAQWDANMALITRTKYYANPQTGEQVGHYLNIINPSWTVMGAGLNAGTTDYVDSNGVDHGWNYDGAGINDFASDLTQESHHTVGEYRSMLDGYTGKLDAANKAYEDARKTTSDRQQALTQAQQAVSDAQARLTAAQQAVSDAQATVNARQ
ncbi:CAP domain-containing protein, partial [Bifidobacterium bohemicum]|uniref:CAP domain-containing protein n=1 Tax=Bifidobacterium bohemicum TaxID=638617 RepID=UPI000529CDAE